MDHYCEAFIAQPGECWRMVTRSESGREGMPTHCAQPAAWRGRTQTRRGQKWLVVDSCDGHVDDELVGVKRVSNDPVPGAKSVDS
jgi:hypothetical protein